MRSTSAASRRVTSDGQDRRTAACGLPPQHRGRGRRPTVGIDGSEVPLRLVDSIGPDAAKLIELSPDAAPAFPDGRRPIS